MNRFRFLLVITVLMLTGIAYGEVPSTTDRWLFKEPLLKEKLLKEQLNKEIRNLQAEIDQLKSKAKDFQSRTTGTILFLYAAFCALWAQNTGRNPWLWFFLGGLTSFISIFFLLYLNAHDRRVKKAIQEGRDRHALSQNRSS